jgi:DNA polymerase-3 subunit delta'
MIRGQDKAVGQFRAAWDGGTLHHAWLLAGPRGVGKGSFARDAARRVLADAAGPRDGLAGLEVPGDHPIAKGQHIADLVITTADTGEQVLPLVAAEAVGEAGFFGRMWIGLKQLFGMA